MFFELKGKIVDVDDEQPVSGVKVELIGPSGTHITTTDGNGEYKISTDHFKENNDYHVRFSKDWYITQNDTSVSTTGYYQGHPLVKELPDGNLVTKMKSNVLFKTSRRPMVLRSVEFDLNKFDLRPEGMEELDSLADLLIHDWPNVVIELRSHTDFRGSQETNLPLSQNRAQSCVDYLVEQGVSVERLVPIGMSDTEPKILSNDSDIDMKGLLAGVLNKDYINALKSNKLKETAHQMNRRTDFKIISYDFDEYLKENENKESPVINRIIDENGDLIEIRE